MTYKFTNAHPLGTVWLQYGTSAYLNIPKCGSSAIKSVLEPMGYRRYNGAYSPFWTVFTVVRHPYDRLVSGIVEYARRNKLSPIAVAQSVRGAMDAGLYEPLDEHTTPQHTFITMPVDEVFVLEDLDPLARFLGIPSIPPRRRTDLTTLAGVRDVLGAVDVDPIDYTLWQSAFLRWERSS